MENEIYELRELTHSGMKYLTGEEVERDRRIE